MKFLSKFLTICLFATPHSTIFSKNMDIEHLSNTCYMEAAIHALSKIDEMNDKLRNCKTLNPGSIPSLYIKLVDKIKDKWTPEKKVFMGTDEIEPGVTLEYFYKKLANEFDTEPDEKGNPTSRYGSFKDSRIGCIDPILTEINTICPTATDDLSLDLVRQRTDELGNITYLLRKMDFSYSLPLQCIYKIQAGFEAILKTESELWLFRKIPKILMLYFNMPPQNKKLAKEITLKKEFIAPDIEFHRRDRSMAKLDPETKKLKDLNCDLVYELFVIGTTQPNFHWWVYAKDSGPDGQWYKYDNFRDHGKVKHFATLKDLETDLAGNHYSMYFFYQLKPPLQQKLAKLKASLQELKAKLQVLQGKLVALRGKVDKDMA